MSHTSVTMMQQRILGRGHVALKSILLDNTISHEVLPTTRKLEKNDSVLNMLVQHREYIVMLLLCLVAGIFLGRYLIKPQTNYPNARLLVRSVDARYNSFIKYPLPKGT